MIARLTARNFRSLKAVGIDFDPKLTALVGANGTGKSAILRALDLLCGQTFPALRSLRLPQDWHGFDDQQELDVRVRFAMPLQFVDKARKSHPIQGFELRCRPYKVKTKKALPGDPNFDFKPLGPRGEDVMVATTAPAKRSAPTFAPLTSVNLELRDQARLLFIDHRRSLFQHQPWARGSVLGRLLSPARRELEKVEIEAGKTHGEAFRERYSIAVEALRTPRVQEIEEVVSDTARRTLGFLGSEAVKDLEVGFGFADPTNPLNSLRLVYREAGMELPAEELGLGVQSAIVVGIFEAFRQIGGDIGTVLIEEPEMYLHPQVQRYFHRLLCDLADTGSCQVIYSTHSPVFADLVRFEGIRLVRRPFGGDTEVAAIDQAADREWLADRREAQKLALITSARGEVLFARRALLTEGPGDVTALRLAAEDRSWDVDAEDLAVVECGARSRSHSSPASLVPWAYQRSCFTTAINGRYPRTRSDVIGRPQKMHATLGSTPRSRRLLARRTCSRASQASRASLASVAGQRTSRDA